MSDTDFRAHDLSSQDCDDRCAAVILRLQEHNNRHTSPFWAYFMAERDRAHARGLNDLRVLHNYVATLRDILEDLEDAQTLRMLDDLEDTYM